MGRRHDELRTGRFDTLRTGRSVTAALLTLSFLLTIECSAAVISFQQGVSPGAGYGTGAVTIRSDLSGMNTNQNSNSQILIGNESSGGTSNGRRRGLFEFDLSAIEAAAAGEPLTIDAVQLVLRTVLTGTNTTGAAVTYNLSLLGGNLDFDEGGVNWNNAPGGAGGAIGMLVSTATFDPVTPDVDRIFDSTDSFRLAVMNALESDPANHLRLIANAASGEGVAGLFNIARFFSDENLPAEHRPELIVTFTVVPEPSTFLGAAALVVTLSSRRRNRR